MYVRWGAWVRSARADSHVLATCHACISTLAPITSRSAGAQCPDRDRSRCNDDGSCTCRPSCPTVATRPSMMG